MGAAVVIDRDGRRIGVYGLAAESGSVLLTRIASRYPSAGRWTLPGGGMEWGETPIGCLEREVLEETGLSVTTAELMDVSTEVFSPPSRRSVHVVFVVYRVRLEGSPRPETDGSTDAVAWHALDRLPPTVPLVTRSLAVASVQSGG